MSQAIDPALIAELHKINSQIEGNLAAFCAELLDSRGVRSKPTPLISAAIEKVMAIAGGNGGAVVEGMITTAALRQSAVAHQSAYFEIGYIQKADLLRLGTYKVTLWPGTNEIDAVPVSLSSTERLKTRL